MDKILKKLPIVATVALLVAGAFLFAGCEKEKPVQPNDNKIKNDTNILYGKDTNILYGKVVAILDPCIGNAMIISVQNDTAIGSDHDLHNSKYFHIGYDTLFAYDNVIAVPTPFDHERQCRYYYKGKALCDIKVNDEIAFTCREIESKEDTSLFLPHTYCLAIYAPPSNMRYYVIKKIVNYKIK